ncbi:helix-turn-helix transcriptional regulator [Sorangium sp. So ce1099]|uniref:helix-turn-helix transcriptional regulator n=1 Tax=Sorangium sp. So ce1099 TaxID=3133331 RepID=UPI003F5FF2CA
MQLYLIPPDGGQGGHAPVRRRQRLTLTPTQSKRLRAALRNLRAAYGTWDCLADVMGVSRSTLRNIVKGHDGGSLAMAMRASKAAGMPVEQILGGLVAADRCPTCGRGG